MARIILEIEYRGTAYCGWQSQPLGGSVQQCVEGALKRLVGEEIRIHGSGRTDKGVHAYGQVAHFDYDGKISAEAFQNALNFYLPNDVSIKRSYYAQDDFHARFSAKEKVYLYKLFLSTARSGLRWDTHYTLHGVLNLTNMRFAVKSILGTHDFASFCAKGSNPKTTVRTLNYIKITAPDLGLDASCANNDALNAPLLNADVIADYGEVLLEFSADSFLYNMVRVLTAQLIKIGQSRLEPNALSDILARRDRSYAKELAPPHGLYLLKVKY